MIYNKIGKLLFPIAFIMLLSLYSCMIASHISQRGEVNAKQDAGEVITKQDAMVNFAVDFSACPAQASGPCTAIIASDAFKTDPTKLMAGKELTAEAWVKIHSTSTGAIFGRMDSAGIYLLVESGKPKVVVRRAVKPTGTVDLIVSSPYSLLPDTWTHLAGVLSFPSTATSTLDLYVDGQSEANVSAAVASTLYTEPGTTYMRAGAYAEGDDITGVPKSSALDGVVDEARLWGVARTQAEIQACMGEELGLNSGTCGRMTDDLIGYFRFNQASGHSVREWSGLGWGVVDYMDKNSSKTPPVEMWDTGWTAGAPILVTD